MGEPLINVWVPGTPKPKGSVQGFVPTYKNGQPVRNPGGGIKVNITDDNPGTRKWMRRVKTVVTDAMAGAQRSEDTALEVEIVCFLERPGGHFGTGRNARQVKDLSPAYPIAEGNGDVDKLARCVLDALNELAFKTDATVQRLVIEKRYAVPTVADDGQGAAILVREAPAQLAHDLPIEERFRAIVNHPDGADPEREVPEDQLALDAA